MDFRFWRRKTAKPPIPHAEIRDSALRSAVEQIVALHGDDAEAYVRRVWPKVVPIFERKAPLPDEPPQWIITMCHGRDSHE